MQSWQIVVFVVVVVNGQRQDNQQINNHDLEKPVVEFDQRKIAKEQTDESSFRKERLFFMASRQTTTRFSVSYTTSSTPYTCAISADAMACTRRRKRGTVFQATSKMTFPEVVNHHLDGALASGNSHLAVQEDHPRLGKTFLTLWTTTYSTQSLTAFATNTAITVSISAMCTITGGTALPTC